MSNPSSLKATKDRHSKLPSWKRRMGLPFVALAKNGGDEVGGGEDLEVALGGVMAFGAVDDSLAGGIPGDLLEGEGMAEEIFCEALAAGGVVGGDGLFAAVVDIEAGVFPGEEIGEFGGTDEFGVAEGVEEAVAEELIQDRLTALHPCGARHQLRGFLSKTPTSLQRCSMVGARSSAGMQWKWPSWVKSPSAARM